MIDRFAFGTLGMLGWDGFGTREENLGDEGLMRGNVVFCDEDMDWFCSGSDSSSPDFRSIWEFAEEFLYTRHGPVLLWRCWFDIDELQMESSKTFASLYIPP